VDLLLVAAYPPTAVRKWPLTLRPQSTFGVMNPGRPPVLIVETDVRGHRLLYVRMLAEAAHVGGYEVHLALRTEARVSTEFAHHLAGVRARMHELARPSIDVVAALSRELGTVRVVVPDGDRFAQRLALRPRWTGSGDLSLLVMRPDRQPGLAALVRSALKRVLLRRAARMPNVRPVLLSSPFAPPAENPGLPVAVDPVILEDAPQDAGTVRNLVGLTADRYWFAVVGVIDTRKNLGVVLDALLAAGLPDAGLCVAGRIDPLARAELEVRRADMVAAGLTLRLVEDALTNAEFDALVRAVECVVVAHSNEGASGVLAKAAAAGTRIVAAGARSLRRDCAALPEQSEWSELRADALAEALTRAYRSPRPAPVRAPAVSAFTRPLLPDPPAADQNCLLDSGPRSAASSGPVSTDRRRGRRP
jgi:glycosyltransferase involved in cell wall biosynthesis